ncbi:MAG: FAD-dependent oxidoreductase [Candidatus Omnitrophota bacterium]|nr:MAG: FAD-dependent oxidoreductase [Candidatus Omnitrophota bacterium]
MSKIYDLIILGAGPAGITGAVYAARKKLDFLVITLDIGGQTVWSGDIENYTGYQFVTGPELASKFREHMEAFKIEVRMPERVTDIKKEGDIIRTITNNAEYLSKTAIVATGKRPRPLGAEGEQEFKNKGVTYCATCDGPLFKDKPVAIIGGGNSGLDAALQMVKISPKVYLIESGAQLSADSLMIDNIKKASNVEICTNSKVNKIYGDTFVKGIEIEKQGKVHNLNVEGIFIEIGLIPNSKFAFILERDEKDEIVVDCYNKTNIEGIFAAGDVTNVPEKQIVIACGEGSKATLSAFRYLSTHKF